MKRNIFFLASLFVVGLCITACGDDDNKDGNTSDRGGSAATVDGKRLVQMIEDDDTLSYEYNSEGKIVMLLYGSDGREKWYYSYNDNQITVSSSYSYSSSSTYTVENGRITKEILSNGSGSDNSVYNYEYDSDGHLIAIRYSSNHTSPATYEHGTSYENSTTNNTTFTWQDGNMIKSVEEYISTTTTKSWTSTTSSTYPYTTTWTPKTVTSTSKSSTVKEYTYTNYDNVLPLFSEVDDVLSWQGYFGKSSKNLPQKMEKTSTSSDGSSNTRIYTYDYTFTGNVVTKMIETKTGSSSSVDKYTFTWE